MERCHWCRKEPAQVERGPQERSYCARCNEVILDPVLKIRYPRHFIEYLDRPLNLKKSAIEDQSKRTEMVIAAIEDVGRRMMSKAPENGRDRDPGASSVARKTKTFAQQSFEDRESW